MCRQMTCITGSRGRIRNRIRTSGQSTAARLPLASGSDPGFTCRHPMRPTGSPLPPIPPALRWSGRAAAWGAVGIGLALVAEGPGATSRPLVWGLAGLTVTLALETHRWLPSQNTVAAALLATLSTVLVATVLGLWSEPGLCLSALTGFAHLMASRGLVRRLCWNRRGRPGYGIAVLMGTTAVATFSQSMTLVLAGVELSPKRLVVLASGVAAAVVSASVWLLVKKPVPETRNPWPAGMWLTLTGGQAMGLASAGHPVAAALAMSAAVSAAAVWLLPMRRAPRQR